MRSTGWQFCYAPLPLKLNLRTSRNFRKTKAGHISFYNLLLIRHLFQACDLRILAGRLHYAVKKTLLGIYPRLACKLFTYNACMITIIDEL